MDTIMLLNWSGCHILSTDQEWRQTSMEEYDEWLWRHHMATKMFSNLSRCHMLSTDQVWRQTSNGKYDFQINKQYRLQFLYFSAKNRLGLKIAHIHIRDAFQQITLSIELWFNKLSDSFCWTIYQFQRIEIRIPNEEVWPFFVSDILFTMRKAVQSKEGIRHNISMAIYNPNMVIYGFIFGILSHCEWWDLHLAIRSREWSHILHHSFN